MNQQKTSKTAKNLLSPRLIFTAILGAWFITAFFFSFSDKSILDPEMVYTKSFGWFLGVWVILTGILLAYGAISPKVIRVTALVGTLVYCLRIAFVAWDNFLTVGLCAVMAFMLWLTDFDWSWIVKANPSRRTRITLTAIFAALTGGFMLFLMLMGHFTYTAEAGNSTAVYRQMLWQMSQHFTPDTTLEFGETVSHFGVHFSPIFYLYLPFYMAIPSPVTLYVLQTAAVLSAVIPLSKIAKAKELSNGMTAVLCLLFCLFPALIGGVSGGFHEYALLIPLLLWLIWALETGKLWGVITFGVLCLCVRETAAVYLIALGLYWLISHGFGKDNENKKQDRVLGLAVAGISLVYLIASLVILTYAGQGTLITRFSNITGIYNTTFGTLIKELLVNPALVLYEMLTTTKLLFVLCLLLPLCVLPFASKKKATLILLLPLLVLNLLSDFSYHIRFDYPYVLGSIAFLFYMIIMTLAERQNQPETSAKTCRRIALAFCFTLIIGAFRGANESYQFEYLFSGTKEPAIITEALESVPEDASVTASGRLLVALSDREQVYTLSHKADTEYVVLDLREEWHQLSDAAKTLESYRANGYSVVTMTDGVIAVLKKGS